MTAASPSAARRSFERRCREHASIKRAVGEKAYLKSDLRFIGTMMPEIREAARDFAREHPELTRTELRGIVDELWSTDVFELRSCGIALLSRRAKLLDERDLPWLIGLVRRSKTWAHVDWLAGEVIANVVGESRTALRRLPGWARDDYFWVRRTALLAQLPQLRRERGDFELFARLAAGMLDEREFFIRKAIGWVLREVSKKRPRLVFAFLREHRSDVSGLTLGEGAKYLPAAQRRALGLRPEAAWIARERRRKASGS
ncbi:MAG TPA: DNA alkylation repair protein [Candidatus Limnocylindria bacterium]|jgi:3-methyladenine DNA glycosylase AlkD|nr:DNA alkylation repair protein [Candidatus Limnocylindria bacterium]